MQDLHESLKNIQGFLLDMDGTVYLGNKLIEGTEEFLEKVERTGRKILFVTNNSSHNASYYQNKLSRMKISVQKEQIMTSGQAAADVLHRMHPGVRVWVFGNDFLKDELREEGIKVVDENPDVVLAGYDNTLTYRKLCEFCNYIRDGLPYIATHPDFNCPVEGGFEPDLGSIMALVEASTGRKADCVAGKPEIDMVLAAQKRLSAQANELAMCGDRLYTDIAVGKRHGLLSILVLSGEAKQADIPKAQYKPDIVIQSLGALIPYL